MSEPKSPAEVSLYTFVTNTPAPVVRLLVELSPLFAMARWMVEVSSWRGAHTSESWLAVFVWWILCFSAGFVYRYLLPVAIVLPFALHELATRIPFLRKWTFTSTAASQPPASDSTISSVLADVQTLDNLLPRFPVALEAIPPLSVLARILLNIYVPYLFITSFVPANVVVGLSGTIVLTWRSPWLVTCRNVLVKSGWVRYLLGRMWSFISGLPAPSMNFLVSPSPSISLTRPDKSTVQGLDVSVLPEPALLRFTFCVMENQRWWMGLDWTAALLPSDRPSWSTQSPSLSPLSPPGSLSLPGPVTVYLPIPSASSGSRTFRMKRTSKWRWEDSEWKVVVGVAGKDGQVNVERIKMDLPLDAEGGSAARLVDAVGKGLRRGHTISASADNGSPTRDRGRMLATHEKDHPSTGAASTIESTQGLTDPEGWVYADNKWENPAPKGGIGKYTRMRRWTRIAVLEEKIEVVPGEPVASNGSSTPLGGSPVPETLLESAAQQAESNTALRQRISSTSNDRA